MVGSGSCTIQSKLVNVFIKDFSEVVYSRVMMKSIGPHQ